MVRATSEANIEALCWQTQAFIAKFKFDEDFDDFDLHGETYYLQTTEDDYAEALRETAASESHSVGTSVGTSAREQDPSLEISAKEKPHKTGALITVDGFGLSHQYTRREWNPCEKPSVSA